VARFAGALATSRVRRPRIDDDPATVGLDRDQLGRLLGAAEVDGPRSVALVSLLVYNGLRISEALSRDVEHFSHQIGHRVLRLTRKGGKRSTEALAPVTVHALELYIGERTTGPVFLGRDGTARLTPVGRLAAHPSPRPQRRHPRRRPVQPPTASGTASPPACWAPVFRCKTCRTPWATPIPAPPGPTTAHGTASTTTPPTPWRHGCGGRPGDPATAGESPSLH